MKTHPVQYVIIGNSAAGISAAAEIRRQDPAGRITMISDEPAFGYSRVLLPLYLAGKKNKKEMVIAPRDFYTSRKIRLLKGDAAVAVEPKEQRVRTASGLRLPYDRLLIATGSSPRRLEVRGNGLPGIHYLRKIADAEAIRADLASSRGPVLIVGGGLVSLKSAEALIARRRKVQLVISSDRVLSMMLDEGASKLFLESLRRSGAGVHLHTDVKAFQGNGRVQRPELFPQLPRLS
jgi:NAD(P)H-nitrite reductase large subunit